MSPLTLICIPLLGLHKYSAWRVIKAPSHRVNDAADVGYIRLFRKCSVCGAVTIKSQTKG